MFEIDYNICENNWCNEIKDIMSKLDIAEHYNNKTVVNMEMAKTNIKQYYANIWQRSVVNVPKLRTYTTFKTQFDQEKYLHLNLKKK